MVLFGCIPNKIWKDYVSGVGLTFLFLISTQITLGPRSLHKVVVHPSKADSDLRYVKVDQLSGIIIMIS